MSVSSEETSPEVYFWNSVSTLDFCDKGKVLYSILNRVGRGFPLVIGGGWTGASDATVAVPTGIRLRYWCICTRCHRDMGKVIDCTYKVQNDLFRIPDILGIPFAFDPCEPYGGIED